MSRTHMVLAINTFSEIVTHATSLGVTAEEYLTDSLMKGELPVGCLSIVSEAQPEAYPRDMPWSTTEEEHDALMGLLALENPSLDKSYHRHGDISVYRDGSRTAASAWLRGGVLTWMGFQVVGNHLSMPFPFPWELALATSVVSRQREARRYETEYVNNPSHEVFSETHLFDEESLAWVQI